MKAGVLVSGVAVLGIALAGCGSGQSMNSSSLDQTIWCSPNVHTRIAVDSRGTVATKDGKNVCVEFSSQATGYVMKTIWWNVSKGIHVEEWAIAEPISDDELNYLEADQGGNPDFPGITGQGSVFLNSDTSMTLEQLGYLSDGSAAGFATTLQRVDTLPEIPVPVTYP
ncbi:MAG: hypothetical protein ACKOW5_14175 [Actinomycetales bacterium]